MERGYRERKIRRGKNDIYPPLDVNKVEERKSNSRAGSHPWGAETPPELQPTEQAVRGSEKNNPLFNLFKKLSTPRQK